IHGSFQADIIDASASLSTPVGEKGSISLSGRKSYVAELGSLLGDQSFQNFFTLPSFGDGSARYRHKISERESIAFGGLFSIDEKTRTTPSDNPEFRAQEYNSLKFMRFDTTYRREDEGGGRLLVVPWYGHDWVDRRSNFGGVEESQALGTHLFGLRTDYQGRAAENIVARVGLDIEFLQS